MAVTGSSRSYAVIGAGALGGYYGAKLHHAGLRVHFLLHSDYAHVKTHGLRVESIFGDFSIAAPNIYSSPRDMERCDVALVGLKTTQNHALPEILPHVVKDDGSVLVMQNGLSIEEEVSRFTKPTQEIVGGLAFLCSNKVGPGHIVHMDYEQVRLGVHAPHGAAGGVTQRLNAIAEDFRRANVPIEIEQDLILARWKKLVWNVPYNGLSVVLDATTEELMRNPETRALCIELMHEVVAGAATQGRMIDESLVQQMVTHTDKMVAYKPSMKLDYDAGRPMEIEAIYGNPLRAAETRGVTLPKMHELYERLKEMERRNHR